jgi:hypothetical protein
MPQRDIPVLAFLHINFIRKKNDISRDDLNI